MDTTRTLGRLLMGASPEPGLDWEPLVELARQDFVSPFLFWRLERGRRNTRGNWEGWTGVPKLVWEQLRGDYVGAVARGLLAEKELTQVLKAFAAAGVQALVAKGKAIGAFYPDPDLRIYGDLDLLVPRTQLDEAEQALNHVGYRCSKPKKWALEQYHHLPPLASADSHLDVELHWRFDDPERVGQLPAKDLWARAEPWSVGGQPALRLEVVDATLYLCRHAVVQHRFHEGLRPLSDLAMLTQGWSHDRWEMLVQRAQVYGLGHVVYLMLMLMEEVLGLAAPPDAMRALQPPGGALSPEGLVERLFHPGAEPTTELPVSTVRAWAKQSRQERLRHFLQHLFLPRNGMAVVYDVPADSWWIWLTYLRRPVDLLQRYGRSVWDGLRGAPAARAAWAREWWLERWLREEDGGDAST